MMMLTPLDSIKDKIESTKFMLKKWLKKLKTWVFLINPTVYIGLFLYYLYQRGGENLRNIVGSDYVCPIMCEHLAAMAVRPGFYRKYFPLGLAVRPGF